MERSVERGVGKAIRDLRLKNHLTLSEISARVGIGRGMLSKIENGLGASSLDTLWRIAQVLGVPLVELFRHHDVPEGGAYLSRARDCIEVVREKGHQAFIYHLLAYDKGPRRAFEPFLISIDHATDVLPEFEHPGTEFIYMLAGSIEYRHGQQLYLLEAGDALTFQGNVPHGPERLVELPIRFLSIIVYDADRERVDTDASRGRRL